MTESPRVAVLYAGTVAPDHGGRRMLEQMASLSAEGWQVSLAPVVSEDAPPAEISPHVGALGIEVREALTVRRRSRAGRALHLFDEEAVEPAALARAAQGADWIVMGNVFLPALAARPTADRRAPVLTWDGDAPSRWHATHRRWLMRHDPQRAVRRAAFAASARRGETRVLAACDAVTVPGPADLATLARRGSRARVLVVPNVVRLADAARAAPPSRDVLFVGSAYGPNLDGLRWFTQRVWPLVRSRAAGARLTLAGRGLAAADELPPLPPEAELLGPVEDLAALYRSARVVVIPLFYGAGVPNKFLEALAVDAGVVITRYVARAVGSPPGLHASDRAGEWAERLVAALDAPADARVKPAVRAALLATHGPDGFDRAMRTLVDFVGRRLGRS